MKTLFGERKSVKTLAFILALALILPLLPVMSVVGETVAIKSVTFVGADSTNGPWFRNEKGDYVDSTISELKITFGSRTYSIEKSEDYEQSKSVKLTPSGGKNLALKFWVEGPDSDEEYIVTVKDGSSQDPAPLSQASDGSYSLAGTGWTDGNLTVTATPKPASHTLTFPTRAQAKTNNYTIISNGKACYGDVEVTESSVEFTVTPTNPTDVPSVLVFWADGTEGTPTESKEGSSYKYKIDQVKNDGEVLIDLHAAVSITYVAEVGSDANSFTVAAKEGSAYSVSYGTENFEFSVTPASGYTIQSVTVNGTKVEKESGYYKITSITAPVTVRVTTKAITSTVEVKGEDDDALPEGVTVNGYPTSVPYNGTVTFTVTVPTGNKVPTVKYSIQGTSRNDVEITPDANGTYTITNVTGKLTITVGELSLQEFNVTYPSAVTGSSNIEVKSGENALSSNKAKYGQTLTVKVTPADYYSVTSVTFTNKDTGATLVSTKSTGENGVVTYTLDSVSSNIAITVECSPITVTVTFKNGPTNYPTSVTLVGSAIKEWLFEANEDGKTVGAFNPAKFNEYQGTAPYRYGVDFVEFTAGNEALDKHLDCTIELTAKWKVNVDEYFVLTTVPTYGNKMITFTTKLSVNENVEQSTQDIVGRDYTISKYGLFYGENGMTLSEGDRNACNTYLNSNKESLKEGFVNAITDVESGRVYLFGYAGTDMRFTVYTHKVSGVQNGSSRSAIAFYIISLDGQEYTIIGQATSITYSPAE